MDNSTLAERYRTIRAFSEVLCAPLVTEDYVIQTMPEVSPAKWHIAHTSWFFETFVLREHQPSYTPPDPLYTYIFNSYYVQIGERHNRPDRGFLSRPTVQETYVYRAHVDSAMLELIEKADDALLERITPLVILGLNHEQQHQELFLTDIKHVFSVNPAYPVYREQTTGSSDGTPGVDWIPFHESLYEIGHKGREFCFDNETPRHRIFLNAFELGSRLVTNREYLEFMEDGGYEDITLWLSDGSATMESEGWKAPLYWEQRDGRWWNYTLAGLRAVHPDEPVCHVSFYEADAYARWAGARLPGEGEWEIASETVAARGNFVESGIYHPHPLQKTREETLMQMIGDVWEWTGSPYSPYPGYRTPPGAVGEYNGKFMSNQFVLRGGSCATSKSHIRHTYRNFFYPYSRWQFTGFRLARDPS